MLLSACSTDLHPSTCHLPASLYHLVRADSPGSNRLQLHVPSWYLILNIKGVAAALLCQRFGHQPSTQ